MSFQEKFAEKLIELGERLKGEVKLEEETKQETKLMEAKTIDGNIIVSPDETLQENSEVFIRTEDGDLPLPAGEYTLEDGTIIVVEQDGLVDSISAPSAEPEQEDEMAAEPQAKKITETIKQEVEFLKNEITELKAIKSEFEKFVEATNKNFEGVADFSEKVTNLLEQPVTKPKKEKQELAEVKPMTTADRVKSIRNNLKIKS